MKYIFLTIVFCFLWAFNMAAIIEYTKLNALKTKIARVNLPSVGKK